MGQIHKIINGEANVSSDKINKNWGMLLHYIALNKMALSLGDLSYDTMSDATGVGASSSYYWNDGSATFLAHGYDEFSSSLDTAKWTDSSTGAASVSNSGGAMNLTTSNSTVANNAIATQKTTGLDFKTLAGDSFLEFSTTTPSYDDGSFLHSCQGSIKVGGTTIVTQSDSHGGGGGAATLPNIGGVFKFFFNKAGGTVKVYKDGSEISGSPFTISGESNWNVIFQFTTSNSTTANGSTWSVTYFRYVGAGGANLTLLSTAATIDSSYAIGYLYASATLNNCTISSSAISFDNGSNYATANQLWGPVDVPHTGTQLIKKVVFTPPASITPSGTYSAFPSVDYWYAWAMEAT